MSNFSSDNASDYIHYYLIFSRRLYVENKMCHTCTVVKPRPTPIPTPSGASLSLSDTITSRNTNYTLDKD